MGTCWTLSRGGRLLMRSMAALCDHSIPAEQQQIKAKAYFLRFIVVPLMGILTRVQTRMSIGCSSPILRHGTTSRCRIVGFTASSLENIAESEHKLRSFQAPGKQSLLFSLF